MRNRTKILRLFYALPIIRGNSPGLVTNAVKIYSDINMTKHVGELQDNYVFNRLPDEKIKYLPLHKTKIVTLKNVKGEKGFVINYVSDASGDEDDEIIDIVNCTISHKYNMNRLQNVTRQIIKHTYDTTYGVLNLTIRL
jgi:hypothetical protein